MEKLDKFSYSSLAELRNTLLDLTNRNRLLNYNFPKAKSLAFADMNANAIAYELILGNSISFEAISRPTKDQLEELGLFHFDKDGSSKIYDEIKSEKWANEFLGYTDKCIFVPYQNSQPKPLLKTFLYLDELESRLKSIYSENKTAIEETGNSILYLTIGFLKWYEDENSDEERFASLFNIPLQIERRNSQRGRYIYSISLSEEGISTNATLKEKLGKEFGLILPEISDDILPEAYFAKIKENILLHKPRWKIVSKSCLSLLNFTKQVMYLDLDPQKWQGASIQLESHPIISKLFSLEGQEGIFNNIEYEIDTIPNIHQNFPLIADADSSQHSALIDAVKGSNLIIEGPPGTGKSQTITNLIAALLNNGKKILFVAEKMAALEVVKKRLDNVGLGQFCLELHSHKANKVEVIKDLERQLENRVTNKNNHSQYLESSIQNYEHAKDKLSSYADLINKEFKNSGKTIHQILSKVARLRKLFPAMVLENFEGKKLELNDINVLKEKGTLLSKVYEKVALQAPQNNIYKHPWYGVNYEFIREEDEEKLIHSLVEWNNDLDKLLNLINNNLISEDKLESITLQDLWILKESINALDEINKLINSEHCFSYFLELLMNNEIDNLVTLLNDYEYVHQNLDKLSNILDENVLEHTELHAEIFLCLEKLKNLTSEDEYDLERLSQYNNEIKELINEFQDVIQAIYEIKQVLPKELFFEASETENGLHEFTKIVTFVEELPLHLYEKRGQFFARDIKVDLDIIEDLSRQRKELHNQLDSFFILSRTPNSEKLAEIFYDLEKHQGIFSFFNSQYRSAKKQLSLFLKSNLGIKETMSNLTNLIKYKQLGENIDKYVEQESFLLSFYQDEELDVSSLLKLYSWYQSIYQEYGMIFGKRVVTGQLLIDLDSRIVRSLHLEGTVLKNKVINCLKRFDELKVIFSTFFDKKLNISLGKDSPILELSQSLDNILSSFEKYISNGKVSIRKIYQSREVLEEINHKIDVNKEKGKKYNLSFMINGLEKDRLNFFRKLAHFYHVVCNNILLRQILTENITLEKFNAVISWVRSLEDINFTEIDKKEKYFSGLAKLDIKMWKQSDDLSLKKLVERNMTAINNRDTLSAWIDFVNFKYSISNGELCCTLKALEEQILEPKDIELFIELSIYNYLSSDIFKENPILNTVSGIMQESLIDSFNKNDRDLMLHQRQQIAFNASQGHIPIGIGSGVKSGYTECSLIMHEASKQKRHIPIRRLLENASQSIQELKPCFMMSPMSVAQYLQPGKFEFDVLIMDEASQILPQDAIGAIARSKNIVIVGDPKQLPPTDFFQSVNMNVSDANTIAINDSESILEAVSSMFITRRLRWHYRSQHESLIAFSNYAFYDSNLVIFPSPKEKSDELGIHFVKLNGHFHNNINLVEVNEIVNEIIRLVEKGEESIGVVAMNKHQQTEIQDALELRLQLDANLQKLFEQKEQKHQLFIKNLENVQGDERDVILISMTYGPEKMSGKVFQRFGPINQSTGWRRLNVLFTRAKKRMKVFSSMSSSDILVNETSSRGVRALRDVLEYCENGRLDKHIITGKAPDSDFEISVMKALKEHGYDCEPQLGVAGFFLDLAVRNPYNPSQFLLGIECDGASYHSAKSARDRDRLRQEILENLGWEIHRIWSTDWFKRPQEQIKRVLDRLSKLVEQSKIENVHVSNLNHTSVDNFSEDDSSIEVERIDESNSLTKRLAEVDHEIRQKYPDTPEHKRLLRPVILDILLNDRPITKEEFVAFIPQHYRESTAPVEGEFLDKILKIIADETT